MENLDYMAPFPQANDFEKVIQIVEVPDESIVLNDTDLGEYLGGLTERQARYYIAAAKYLGILGKDKHFTLLGQQIRTKNASMQKIELARLLLGDPVFGKVYISEKVFHISLEKNDVAELIEEVMPGYSEAIYLRRAQTAMGWVEWLRSFLNDG